MAKGLDEPSTAIFGQSGIFQIYVCSECTLSYLNPLDQKNVTMTKITEVFLALNLTLLVTFY